MTNYYRWYCEGMSRMGFFPTDWIGWANSTQNRQAAASTERCQNALVALLHIEDEDTSMQYIALGAARLDVRGPVGTCFSFRLCIVVERQRLIAAVSRGFPAGRHLGLTAFRARRVRKVAELGTAGRCG
jgi:hypothetical protein